MDIRKRLEQEHSKALTTTIQNYVGNNKTRFRQLITLFLGNDPVLVQRSAWPLSYIAMEFPALVKPYIGKLVKKLQLPNQHPAVTRNILRIFQQMDLPDKHLGPLVDVCMAFITSELQPAAIRAFAITTAANICKTYPELKNELRLTLNELNSYPQLPAVKYRIKTALKALQPA